MKCAGYFLCASFDSFTLSSPTPGFLVAKLIKGHNIFHSKKFVCLGPNWPYQADFCWLVARQSVKPKGKEKAEKESLALASDAVAAYLKVPLEEASPEDILEAEILATTTLISLFLEHAAIWEAMEVSSTVAKISASRNACRSSLRFLKFPLRSNGCSTCSRWLPFD